MGMTGNDLRHGFSANTEHSLISSKPLFFFFFFFFSLSLYLPFWFFIIFIFSSLAAFRRTLIPSLLRTNCSEERRGHAQGQRTYTCQNIIIKQVTFFNMTCEYEIKGLEL
jgi:hypothetical protein